jgi:hypothetical protein
MIWEKGRVWEKSRTLFSLKGGQSKSVPDEEIPDSLLSPGTTPSSIPNAWQFEVADPAILEIPVNWPTDPVHGLASNPYCSCGIPGHEAQLDGRFEMIIKRLRAVLAISLAVAGLVGSAYGEVIRVQMSPNSPFAGRAPIDFTGVESSAAADPIFGSDGSNTWNHLTIAPGSTATTDSSFSNLADSVGATTSVGISFTETLYSASDTLLNSVGSNGLENEYFLIGTNTVSYTISGLPADTQVALYLYSPNFTHYDSEGDSTDEPNRGYDLVANGTTISVPSGYGINNALAFVTTNASGDISGIVYTPDGNEGDWSGFQNHVRVRARAEQLVTSRERLPWSDHGLQTQT